VTEKTDRLQISKILAERIRGLRMLRGLTQEEVAEAIGCHESAVSRWESASRMPPCADVLALAELFGVSVDELLGRRDQPTRRDSALLDKALLDQLGAAGDTQEFDELVSKLGQQAIWVAIPEGAIVVPLSEALRRTKEIAERFPESKFADRLFRPRR
jgi:transcriptional regulator with XRE-family HTH domain